MDVGECSHLVERASLSGLSVSTDATGWRMGVFEVDAKAIEAEIVETRGGSKTSPSSPDSAAEEDFEQQVTQAGASGCSHAQRAAERRLREAVQKPKSAWSSSNASRLDKPALSRRAQ
mmetsp:Transcript_29806/g.66842  ORF Transcript_29806/g.66842 Transcript_29806/m.66842 type:complete len:118 (-) Transcript_29806:295-648(-)